MTSSPFRTLLALRQPTAAAGLALGLLSSASAFAAATSDLVVTVRNETPWAGSDRGRALRHAMCSTHIVLRATAGGRFVSLTDPPAEWREAAAE